MNVALQLFLSFRTKDVKKELKKEEADKELKKELEEEEAKPVRKEPLSLEELLAKKKAEEEARNRVRQMIKLFLVSLFCTYFHIVFGFLF